MACLRVLRWLAPAALLLTVAGCGVGAPIEQQCMSTDATNAIVAQAALVKIAVYPAGTVCDGTLVAADAPAPIKLSTFTLGQAIVLDVPPGTHTVALMAYDDIAGTKALGAGCIQDASFQPGQKVCIDLSVTAV